MEEKLYQYANLHPDGHRYKRTHTRTTTADYAPIPERWVRVDYKNRYNLIPAHDQKHASPAPRRKRSKRKKENVLANARRAARNGLPYQTKSPKLQDVAAATHAAEAAAYAADKAADCAREAADKAKEDAADARASARAILLAFENNQRIISLAGEVKETTALAKRNEARLNTHDHDNKVFGTPPQRLSKGVQCCIQEL